MQFDNMDAAKKECISLQSECWGVMDMGCGGEKLFLCSDETPDNGLLRSYTQGTCVYEKVGQSYSGPSFVSHALRPIGSYAVLMLLTFWALAAGVGHA